MYDVKFNLRTDTIDYENTNLSTSWEWEIIKSIEEFNNRKSRKIDDATIELLEINEKDFTIQVYIDEKFNPKSRSFYTRIGALSRTLKGLGMHKLLSPHGKLFSLEVVSSKDSTQISDNKQKENEKTIYLDYKNYIIMIPKEMIEKYSLKFY